MADRPRWTTGALSHDFGGRARPWHTYSDPVYTDPDDPRAVACSWPSKWRPIAVAILDLPVPVRDEPAAVSGDVTRG